MRERLSVLLFTVLVLILVTSTGGCIQNLGREPGWGKETTLLFDLDDDAVIPDRPVVVFLIDGLHKGTFDQMLAAGELPHIKHYLVDRGVTIDNAVACLPTVTFADITSYATGVYPGHHGILGNKWFDPRYLESQDYTTIDTMSQVNDDIQAPTLYEILDREESLVVLTQINRGATVFHENWMRVGPAWFFKMFRNVSLSTTARLQNAVERANETGRWPDLITLYYPSTDEVAHLYGPDDERYREMIRVFDAEVGDACKAFEKEGFLDKVLLVMVTDHGMVPVTQHSDIVEEERRRGVKVWTKAITEQWGHYRKRFDRLADYDLAVIVDSDRLAKLYLLPERGAALTPPSEKDLGEMLARGEARDFTRHCAALPGVQFVACGDRTGEEAHVTVYSADGVGVITRKMNPMSQFYLSGVRANRDRTPGYAYKVVEGKDPFGYSDHEAASRLVGGEVHPADVWLAATIDTEYPDFVHQLPEMFDHERTGDICLFAKPDWDFGSSCRGGHGGLTRDETVVPMIYAGAGLPKGAHIRYARTLALVPTIVHFIRGEKDPAIFAGFDADSLLDNLRAAGENGGS